ncbi:MAG TPA: hypothetical protein VGY98_11005 [Verrucomicrobiae bacterium]|nr:hypothetical protein [Verrucomicrobiae bacterium]
MEKSELELPEPGVNVIIQCDGFRCLGYRTHDGKWKAAFRDVELENVLRVIPLEEPAEFSVPASCSAVGRRK